ncbi:MAG: hypothetical protein ACFFBD_22015, partial [Candidatus Hodarchaeota archaeon]
METQKKHSLNSLDLTFQRKPGDRLMLGAIFRLVLTRMSRRRLPQIEGELQVPGLHEPVEVLRDRWNIP